MTAKVPVPLPGQRGYRVNLATGTIHLRYAPHAAGSVKTNTPQGVLNLLGDRKPKPCKECFPYGLKSAPNVEAPSRGQRRRVSPLKAAPDA